MANKEPELSEELKEEMAKYEEKGFFARLISMFKGLGKPHNTREYKEAVIELQRLSAPLTAFLIPTIGVTILFVVTAVGGNSKKEIKVEVVQQDTEEEKLEEVEEPPPEDTPPPDTEIEVEMDTPNMTPTDVAAPTPDTATAEPQSPKVNSVDAMQNIQSPVMMKSVMGSSRATGVRGQYTKGGAQYGDAQTEAAVMKALRWLKKNQNANGSWGGMPGAAAAGFAILTYLAHGETPGSKEFGETVRKALDYLINCQEIDKNGVCRLKRGTGDGHEYAFLISTYALCEAYGMTKNPNAGQAAKRGMERIIQNQSPTGGWDYEMKKTSTRDDLSFAGWALQALKAGKMAGLHPNGLDEAIKRAIRCLKTRNFKKGGFNYCAGGNPTGLTATGCLCMQLLGYAKEKEVASALDYMREWVPTFDAKHPGGNAAQYYSYYASQCKYQAGMCQNATSANQTSWKNWNLAMKALYPKSIIDDKGKDGKPITIEGIDGKPHPIGHWEGNDNYAKMQPMATCLVALQLMVYYRYLPTTSLKATEVEVDVEAASKDAGNEVSVSIDL